MPENPLQLLASRYGITLETSRSKPGQSGTGDRQLASILRAIGLPIEDDLDAGHVLRQEKEHQRRQILNPAMVLQETAEPLHIPIRLEEKDDQFYQWTLTKESGDQLQGRFHLNDLVAVSSGGNMDHGYAMYHLNLEISLPCGYHQFELRRADQVNDEPIASLFLVVCPTSCYVPPGISSDSRIWGISTHLQPVRSRNNWGIGDFTDLKEILTWGAEQGAGTIHTSPLNSLLIPFQKAPNPYSPSSRSLLNTLFLDVTSITDFAECDDVCSTFHKPEFQARLAMLRDQDIIDYEAVHKIKEEVLTKLWKHFSDYHLSPETARGRDFRHFQHQGGDTLQYYGIFSVIASEYHSGPQNSPHLSNWPPKLRTPCSEGIAEFFKTHEDEIEYQQYLQWQADIQLKAIGRRSMELGLKVGLLGEFCFAADINGFETWYSNEFACNELRITENPFSDPVNDPAVGLPLLHPNHLVNCRFLPFIEGLHNNMQHNGGLILKSMPNYFQTHVVYVENGEDVNAVVHFPFTDMLNIIALESQRNRCLIIADQTDLLPEAQQLELQQRNIFSRKILFQTKDDQGNRLAVSDYPLQAVISSSAPFLTTMKGFWTGKDINVKTEADFFSTDTEKEEAILARASDRAHLLINLDHEKLLPAGVVVAPAQAAAMDLALISSVQILLARSQAKMLLVSMLDLLVMEDQASLPVMTDQSFWQMRLPMDLDTIVSNRDILTLFMALCKERGLGVVRPSASVTDRKKRQGLRIPTSFYRLQLNKDFTFQQAAEIIPYLHGLGISHLYVSPILGARPGSPHGYDIISHSSINSEIGTREDFAMLLALLEEHQMALIIDIVPNHMGIGSDNQWWMDVLENGEISMYADFFDINWHPRQEAMSGRILLPFLGDHYGNILESGQLHLKFNENNGNFFIQYYDHRFPITPGSYPTIINYDLTRLSNRLDKQHNGFLELANLISSLDNLPNRRERSEETIKTNHRNKEVNKRILARICRDYPEIKQFIEENVILFNGEIAKPNSFDLLHNLLEQQVYRLAYWRVAADEINYRRFFDINDLAGLRMEESRVFHETHAFILDLITTGKVDGLRVDHPDGLYDPQQYFLRLQTASAGEPLDQIAVDREKFADKKKIPLYVVAEKVLADFEYLPETWSVNGTTGYDFSNLLNGLLLDASAEKPLTDLYHQFIGTRIDFDELLYSSKKLIIRSSMAGELNVLANRLYRLAQLDRTTRDFTFNLLSDALGVVVACFPVYRTYITSQTIHKRDIRFVDWAVATAKTKKRLDDQSVFGFIKTILLLEGTAQAVDLSKRLDFVMKFQQYTGPVMAKGLEDTTFYIYNRLLSLNEVGSNPRRFGVSVAAFHRTNQHRLQHFPSSMINSSTHDSKRSEDVRARINVLTEMVPDWKNLVSHWNELNRSHKSRLEKITAPSRNDEYAFYQNLVGSWPIEPVCGQKRDAFINRMQESMIKGCREAKVHTSWINPNIPYENGLIRFVQGTLAESDSLFLKDFLSRHQDFSWFGMLNSLSQVFLKLVSPGIPDIYQGNELWRFCLVDPDNRRPVDFQKRQTMLFHMLDRIEGEADRETLQQELLANLTDGRAKMYVIVQTLRQRNSWPIVFDRGSYLPLEVLGSKSRHICAFARKAGARVIIAVAPRLHLTLLQGERQIPLKQNIWGDTSIKLPQNWIHTELENLFCDEPVRKYTLDNGVRFLQVGDLLHCWPVALLKGTVQ